MPTDVRPVSLIPCEAMIGIAAIHRVTPIAALERNHFNESDCAFSQGARLRDGGSQGLRARGGISCSRKLQLVSILVPVLCPAGNA